MKKVYGFLLLLFLSTVGFSQRGSLQVGIKGGVNLSNYDDGDDGDARVGFHVGGLLHIHTQNPRLALQPEFVFSTQGASFGDGTQKIDYLNIPFLIQYIGRGGLRLETGPQVGALISAKFEDNEDNEFSIKNSFKKSDFGWVFGLGFLSSSGLGVDARYNLGLTDITKGRGNVMNRVWQFGIFYQFRPQ